MSDSMRQMARDFAIEVHGDQTYGRSAVPFVQHLDDVARLVEQFAPDDDVAIAVAFLHDSLEDTDCEPERIFRSFGPSVFRDVQSLTDSNGHNRRDRKRQTYVRWLHEGLTRTAALVKVCDRIANVRQVKAQGRDSQGLRRMYAREMEEFVTCIKYAVEGNGPWEQAMDLLYNEAQDL